MVGAAGAKPAKGQHARCASKAFKGKAKYTKRHTTCKKARKSQTPSKRWGKDRRADPRHRYGDRHGDGNWHWDRRGDDNEHRRSSHRRSRTGDRHRYSDGRDHRYHDRSRSDHLGPAHHTYTASSPANRRRRVRGQRVRDRDLSTDDLALPDDHRTRPVSTAR